MAAVLVPPQIRHAVAVTCICRSGMIEIKRNRLCGPNLVLVTLYACLALILCDDHAALADRAAEEIFLAEIRRMRASPQHNEIEQKAIVNANGRAERQGKSLVLTLANGRKERFVDLRVGCDTVPVKFARCIVHHLVAHLPSRRAFIIEYTLYEGGGAFLVDDRTGRRTLLSAEPTFGPRDDIFLVIDDDYSLGSGDELQIWRREGDRVVRIWNWRRSEEPEERNIELIRWEKKGEIELEMRWQPEGSPDDECWPAVLREGKAGWQLDMNWREQKRSCQRYR